MKKAVAILNVLGGCFQVGFIVGLYMLFGDAFIASQTLVPIYNLVGTIK